MASDPAIWAITPNGIRLGLRLCRRMEGASVFVPDREIDNPSLDGHAGVHFFPSLRPTLKAEFNRFSAHIFIFSTGIAVRMIAPLLDSKLRDPAVVVLDEKGLHAISLVSGHLGGANALARRVADLINAVPVITTATDLNKLPSIDMIAKEAGLTIETPGAIKFANMKLLKGEPVSIVDPLKLITPQIPAHLITTKTQKVPDIICTWVTMKVPRETLVLRPKNLVIGMGCNRNTPMADMLEFLTATFKNENLSMTSISALATTSVKADEEGMLALAEELDIPIRFYDKDQLNSVETIVNPSKMAEKYLGVKSVCEAAAILGANRGRLILPKKKTRDVTLAAALAE
ncbi:MAG: cobalt-precorrin 5A hydrolase [Desulfobacter sp.]|nr:MAG: cobalt-precorrin 5A hydrolase [Desulfobacter sp.]